MISTQKARERTVALVSSVVFVTFAFFVMLFSGAPAWLAAVFAVGTFVTGVGIIVAVNWSVDWTLRGKP